MPDRQRVIVWADPGQETLLADAVREAGLDLVAVGGREPAASAALSAALDVERVGDLRLAIQRDDVDLLWLASSEPVDADERQLIRQLGVRAVSSEPRPMSIADLLMNAEEAATATFVPLLRRSPGYLLATEALAEFGERQCVDISVGSGPGQGSLFARLFDAMDLLEALCGPAESVDATLAGPVPGVPEALADVHGHATVNARFAESRCACIAASDGAGSWFRRVLVLGPAGSLRIDDAGYEWIGDDGTTIETSRPEAPVSPGRLIGRHVARLSANLDAGSPPPDTARLLALCEAARLSGRTGQGEAPARLLEMRSRP